MTQDKMRKVITACVSAATVLLVFLLCFLVYQWITIGVHDKKIYKVEAEIISLQMQLENAESDAEYYQTKQWLMWKLEELELLKDKK